MLVTYKSIRMVARPRRLAPFIGHQHLTTHAVSYITIKAGAISETVLLLWDVRL